METEHKLRELASWYRGYAERTENPVIWDARIRTADDLDAEADRIEGRRAGGEPASALKKPDRLFRRIPRN